MVQNILHAQQLQEDPESIFNDDMSLMCNPSLYFAVQNSLAKERLDLTFKDWLAIEEEIHGVRCSVYKLKLILDPNICHFVECTHEGTPIKKTKITPTQRMIPTLYPFPDAIAVQNPCESWRPSRLLYKCFKTHNWLCIKILKSCHTLGIL